MLRECWKIFIVRKIKKVKHQKATGRNYKKYNRKMFYKIEKTVKIKY